MARRLIAGSQFQDLKATLFNGVDQHAYVDDPTWKADTQGAFYLWYRPSTVLTATGTKGILAYGVRGSNTSTFTMFHRRSPSTGAFGNQPIPDMFFRADHAGTIDRAFGSHVFIAGQWGLLGLESNGSTWVWTWNGVSIGGTVWSGAANTGGWLGDVSGTDHRMSVGARFFNNGYLDFDDNRTNELLYFRRPLTSGERLALYNGGVSRNPRRVVAVADIGSWWRMGESRDDATTIYDEIGSNHLTLVNMSAANYVTP